MNRIQQPAMPNDPMRLCPECRMPISVLANRCPHCGSIVGRPRKETEVLTVKDLGGESKAQHVVSGNVREAMEAFISEQQAMARARMLEEEEQKKRSLFRKKNREDETVPPSSDPILGDTPTPFRSTSVSRRRPPSPMMEMARKIIMATGLLVFLVLSGLLLNIAVNAYRARSRDTGQQTIVYPNRAMELLNAGNVVEAVEEAARALKYNDTAENRAIQEKVREVVLDQIAAYLSKTPFSMADLNAASELISRVILVDGNPRVAQMRDKVNRELDFHKFILVRIDESQKTATFKLNNPAMAQAEQTVSEGEYLQDRFLVKKIGPNFVRLEDSQVVSPAGTPRGLTARLMTQVAGS
ncbi:MAG TPA: hypothetical protein PK349_00035 [Candidatus Hydrogenedentes bacterium]|nr:hypothetical protein [Candidatus Hydrogenedentota bacterium]